MTTEELSYYVLGSYAKKNIQIHPIVQVYTVVESSSPRGIEEYRFGSNADSANSHKVRKIKKCSETSTTNFLKEAKIPD